MSLTGELWGMLPPEDDSTPKPPEVGTTDLVIRQARIIHELRVELEALKKVTACTRSHPHEAMAQDCELRTEIARLTNELAGLRAAPAQEEVKQPTLPEGWVQCTVTYEGQHPEGVAYGPRQMMARLKKWLDCYFEMKVSQQHAPGEPTLSVEREPDYWSGGHFYEGTKPWINPTKVWALPIGTKLYADPTPTQPVPCSGGPYVG